MEQIAVQPNYEDWKNVPSWEAWEAIMLLSNIEPDQFFYTLMNQKNTWPSLVKDTANPVHVIISRFYKCARVIEKAIYAGEVTNGKFLNPYYHATAKPAEFIAIAKKYNLSIPIELNDIEPQANLNEELSDDTLITRNLNNIDLDKLGLGDALKTLLKQRIDEMIKCFKANAPLATIFLCGSTLETILLNVAKKKENDFLQLSTAPKKNKNKTLPINDWRLVDLINAAHSLGLIGEDAKRSSHDLRYFRNYIHPSEQLKANFHPDQNTAQMCLHALQISIIQLSNNK